MNTLSIPKISAGCTFPLAGSDVDEAALVAVGLVACVCTAACVAVAAVFVACAAAVAVGAVVGNPVSVTFVGVAVDGVLVVLVDLVVGVAEGVLVVWVTVSVGVVVIVRTGTVVVLGTVVRVGIVGTGVSLGFGMTGGAVGACGVIPVSVATHTGPVISVEDLHELSVVEIISQVYFIPGNASKFTVPEPENVRPDPPSSLTTIEYPAGATQVPTRGMHDMRPSDALF